MVNLSLYLHCLVSCKISYRLRGVILSVPVDFVLDTGAAVSLIREDVWSRCHSGFCPPQKVSPRTQSASGFCPGGYNPLADSVRGDTIRQRILSGETCSASGFCPSSAECVPPPPSPPSLQPLHLISERV